MLAMMQTGAPNGSLRRLGEPSMKLMSVHVSGLWREAPELAIIWLIGSIGAIIGVLFVSVLAARFLATDMAPVNAHECDRAVAHHPCDVP